MLWSFLSQNRRFGSTTLSWPTIETPKTDGQSTKVRNPRGGYELGETKSVSV